MLAIVACGGGPAPQAAPRAGPARIATGVNPAAVAVGAGDAWIANAGEGTVWKVDLARDRVVDRIRIGDAAAFGRACEARNIHQVPHGSFSIRNCDLPKTLAVSPGAVWVANNDTRSLLRIDPRTDRVVADIPIGVGAWYLAAGPGAVWASDYDTDTVVRVDPGSNRVAAVITGLPHGPSGIVAAFGAVWVACSRADVLARIDPLQNRVVAVIPTGHTPLPVAAGFGSVWVRNEASEAAGTVLRVDPTSDRVIATVPVGMEAGRDGLDGLAVTAAGVWVAGLYLERIDPASDRVVERLPHTANAVVAGAGSIWTIDLAYSVTRLPGG